MTELAWRIASVLIIYGTYIWCFWMVVILATLDVLTRRIGQRT